MKLYTKRGDEGETSLASGKAVRKTSARIEAYGTVDELNSILGLAVESILADERLIGSESQDIARFLIETQSCLFSIGSELSFEQSMAPESASWDLVDETSVQQIEGVIDHYSEKLPPLRNFVLPVATLRMPIYTWPEPCPDESKDVAGV